MQTAATILLDAEQTEPIMQVLPATPAAPAATLAEIPLAQIRTQNNYRESMDAVALAELAANIKQMGLIQPVSLRILPEDLQADGKLYDLAAGFRRFAAHEIAGLSTILSVVREMTEQEVLEARTVENLHRENLHPADEARSVAVLAAEGKSNPEIAARLGKSLYWVAQRRALNDLLPEWMKVLREDKMSLLAAEELARWPQDVQQRLFEKRPSYRVEGQTVKSWLASEKGILSAAPWQLADETLVPAAGACSSCQKRSSCATELFPTTEVKKDSCLDSACWATKLLAQIERKLAEVGTEEQPAYRISSHFGSSSNALSPAKYEITKRKTGSVPAVLVDGPSAGHARRVILLGQSMSVKPGDTVATPQKSIGEQRKESRRTNLLFAARKQVTARRIMQQLNAEPEQAATVVYAMLVHLVEEKLQKGNHLDDATLDDFIADWQWQPRPTEWMKRQTWLREQIHASAPTTEKVIALLLYVTARLHLHRQYENYQGELLRSLALPMLSEGLEDDTVKEMERHYDPLTLRPRKK